MNPSTIFRFSMIAGLVLITATPVAVGLFAPGGISAQTDVRQEDRRADRQQDRRQDRREDRQADRREDRRLDRQEDRRADRHAQHVDARVDRSGRGR